LRIYTYGEIALIIYIWRDNIDYIERDSIDYTYRKIMCIDI